MSDEGRIEVQIEVVLNGVENFKQVTAAAQKLDDQMKGMNGTLKSQGDRWERLRSALSDLEQRYDGVFRAGFRLVSSGRQLTDVGQDILGFLTDASDAWGDYEFMLNRAAGALDLFDDTAPLYKALSDGIIKLAQDVRIFPADKVAQSMYFWASTTGQAIKSQKDLNLVLAQLNPILKTAALTETDYETAIKTAYNVTEQFGLGIGKAGEVTEKMLIIAQRTSAEFGDLAGSLKYVGPVAAQMKVPFDEVVKTLGLIADSGIRSTQAGRALRQMFIQTLRPSAKAREAYNDVFAATFHVQDGFNKLIFPDGKYVGLTKHVRLLAQATMHMTDAEKGHFLATISTANELPVLTSLVAKETEALKHGKDAIDAQKYSLDGYRETFEKMFDLLGNSWKGLMGLLQNSILPLQLRIGSSFAKMMAPWIDTIAKVVQGISDWMEQNPKLVDFAVKVAAITGVLLVVAGAIITVIGSLILFGAGIVVTIGSIGIMLNILGVFVAAWIGIGAVIAGVTSIVVENISVIKERYNSVLQNLKVTLSNLGLTLDGVGDNFRNLVDTGLKYLRVWVLNATIEIEKFTGWLARMSANKEVQAVVHQIADALRQLVTVILQIKAATFVLNGFIGTVLIMAGLVGIVAKLTYVFLGLGRVVAILKAVKAATLFLYANPLIAGILALALAAGALYAAWRENFGGIRDIVSGWMVKIEAVFDKVGGVINELVRIFQGMARPVIEIFQRSLPAAIKYFTDLWDTVADSVVDGVSQIGTSVTSVFRQIVHIIEDTVVPTLQEHLGPIWNNLVKIIAFALSVAAAVISGFVKAAEFEFDFFAHVIVPSVEIALHVLLAIFQAVFPLIVSVVDGTLSTIAGLIEVVTGLLTLNWAKAWQGAVDVVGGFFTAVHGLILPLQVFAALLITIATGAMIQFAAVMAKNVILAVLALQSQIRLLIWYYGGLAVAIVKNVIASMISFGLQLAYRVADLIIFIAKMVLATASAIAFAVANTSTIIPSLIAVGNALVAGAVKWAAYWLAALGPIGIAIGVVAALAAAWITDFLGIRTALTQVNDATQKWLDTVPGIKQVREALFGLKGSADDISYLEQAFQNSGVTIQNAAARMNADADELGISYEDMSHKVAVAMQNTGQTWDQVMAEIEAKLPSHKEKVKQEAAATGEAAKQGFSEGIANLPPEVQALFDSNLPAAITTAQPSMHTAALQYANLIPGTIIPADEAALSNVKTTYSEMYNTILTSKDQVKSVMDQFDEVLKQPKRTNAQAVKEMITDLKKLAPALDGSLGVDAKAAAQSGSEKILEVLKSLDEDAYEKYIHTAKGLPDAFKNEKARVDAEVENVTQHGVIDKVTSMKRRTIQEARLAAGGVPPEFTSAKPKLDEAVATYLSGATTKFTNFKANVAAWGSGAARVYANSWGSWGDYLQTKISDYLAYGTHILRTQSPPKAGPFHEIDKWAAGAARVYADSFAGQKRYLTDSVSDFLSVAGMQMSGTVGNIASDFSIDTNNKKELKITVDVTSSDGSVTQENAQSIADAIHKGLLIDRVERMAGL